MSSIAEVVTSLAGARRAVQLYPPAHPAFGQPLDELVAAVTSLTEEGPFVLNWHEGRLYHESIVLPDDISGIRSVAECFESHTVESLTFNAGFTREDALGLTEVLTLRPSPSFDVVAELESRGVAGVVAAKLVDEHDEEREERDRQRDSDRAMYQRVVSALRKLQERLSSGGADLGDSTDLVGNVMQRMLADPSAVMGLATIRGSSEHNLFHSLNVMIYSLALGHRLGLPEEGLESLGLSALLHDVGKAAFIADDPEQAEPMRLMHPKVGADILQRVALQDPAPMLVAYEHHMGAGGTGWPESEPGYIAHPYSRMVAIANRYENLTNPEDGTPALTPDRAVVQVLKEGGTQLDPFFVRLFANALGAFPVGCLVRLSDQSVGVVAKAGEDPLTPVVRVSYDERGTELDDPYELDLEDGDVRIVEVIHPDDLRLDVSEKL